MAQGIAFIFGRIIDTHVDIIARLCCAKISSLALCEFVNFSSQSRYWRLSSCRLCDSVKPIFTDKAETG